MGLPDDADLAPARAALNTLRSTKHRAPRSRQTAGSGAGGVAHPKRKGIFGPGAEPAKQSGGAQFCMVKFPVPVLYAHLDLQPCCIVPAQCGLQHTADTRVQQNWIAKRSWVAVQSGCMRRAGDLCG